MRIAPTVTAHEICDTNVALDLRPAHAAARRLYPQHLQVPAVLGILPARSDGPGDGHGCDPRALQRADPHHRNRGGRERLPAASRPRSFRSASPRRRSIRRSRSPTIRSTGTSPPTRSTRRSFSSRRLLWLARRRRSGSQRPAAPVASPIRIGAAANVWLSLDGTHLQPDRHDRWPGAAGRPVVFAA